MTGRGARQRRDTMRGRLGVLRRELKAANAIVEVLDARAPASTAARRFLGDQARKCRGVVLTKIDLAEAGQTKRWVEALEDAGIIVCAVDLTKTKQAKKLLKDFVADVARQVKTALGVVRLAIVGLPNVGKSTLINRLFGRNRAATGNRPGVTKGKQWIRVSDGVTLLDTPGVIQLFAGLERELGDDFFKLVLCNVVPAGQYDEVEVVEETLAFLRDSFDAWPFAAYYDEVFTQLYEQLPIGDVLSCYAAEMHLLAKGGLPDADTAARRFLADWRRGKIGPLTLEVAR